MSGLGFRQMVEAADQLDVLPAGQLGMKARADLEERADAAMEFGPTLRRIGNA